MSTNQHDPQAPGFHGKLVVPAVDSSLNLEPAASVNIESDPLEPEFGRVAGSVAIDAAIAATHHRNAVLLSKSA